ncbi:MAG: DNA-binding protein [Massilia sp.]|jgi:transcriptional regulator with XRE-family HTH domain|nr:DNA-binding protein [Gemmatimonadales bacterium]MDB5910477.1 DNA-binding protein [Massilia sp.]
MTSFGERLASVRKRRGLTQRELASESGVSVSLIRQLEQGHLTATRADTARKLAVALRVLTTDLMPRDETAEAVPQVVEEWTSVRRALEGRRIGSGRRGTAIAPLPA